ncbi:hypothetical protein HU200_011331 [Digitaria exilis]|uniref:Calcineurin-like phosphoesterase domain-containing protein n=1 Tax=Digitaria exilis TaxID=1010633 RepID=A0A835KMT2_9POAL|nr:hypothetical protein HU200_011331 [Digitaria exilis]
MMDSILVAASPSRMDVEWLGSTGPQAETTRRKAAQGGEVAKREAPWSTALGPERRLAERKGVGDDLGAGEGVSRARRVGSATEGGLSDLHFSVHHPERAYDFRRYVGPALAMVNPDLVLITGDLTGTSWDPSLDPRSRLCLITLCFRAASNVNELRWEKQRSTNDEAERVEWVEYESTLNDIIQISRLPRSIFYDLRGNHDSFGVPESGGDYDFYQKYSINAKLRRQGVSKALLWSNKENCSDKQLILKISGNGRWRLEKEQKYEDTAIDDGHVSYTDIDFSRYWLQIEVMDITGDISVSQLRPFSVNGLTARSSCEGLCYEPFGHAPLDSTIRIPRTTRKRSGGCGLERAAVRSGPAPSNPWRPLLEVMPWEVKWIDPEVKRDLVIETVKASAPPEETEQRAEQMPADGEATISTCVTEDGIHQ